MLRISDKSVCLNGWCLPLNRPGRIKAVISTNQCHDLLLGTHRYHCMYATSLRLPSIVKRSALSTAAAATCVDSRQIFMLQATKATVVVHRLLAQSQPNHHFLCLSGTRAFSKRPKHRPEPWVVGEIRKSLIVAQRYDYSLWQMASEMEFTSLEELRQSDHGQVLKHLSRLRRSVVPEHNWSIPDPIWRYKGYKRAEMALRGFLLTDARNSSNYLSPEENRGFTKLLESESKMLFWCYGTLSFFFYSVLAAVIYWILKRMMIIKTTTSKSTEDVHKEQL